MSSFTKKYQVKKWTCQTLYSIIVEHIDDCFWQHNYWYMLEWDFKLNPRFISLDALFEHYWYKLETEEHKITKKMKEWKETNNWIFKDWNHFWKEFFEELNKQLDRI